MNYSALTQQLLPEIVLVVTALAVLAVSVAREAKTGRPIHADLAIALCAVGMAVAGVALALCPAGLESGTDMLTMDPLARMAKGLLLGLGVLAVLLPPRRGSIAHPGEYYALLLFALCGMMLAVGANHLLFLLVALELSSLSLYLLAGFRHDRRAAEASLKYFLFGAVSSAFMLYGLGLVYGFARTLSLPGVAEAMAAGSLPPFAVAGLLLVLVGMAFKLAAAPFHYWAPDVYEGAPATTVGLVAAASKAVGVVVTVRLFLIGFGGAGGAAGFGGLQPGWAVWFAVLAAVSMLWGNLLALAQTGMRRLLAYSAVANTGYLFVALAANGEKAAGTALFYVVVYGLSTFGALAVTAAVERDRGSDSITSFAGLVHRSPLQAVALLIFLMSLAGIPPLAGFIGKFAMFSEAVAATATAEHAGLIWLVVIGAVMSAVSLYYYLKVVKQAFVREAAAAGPAASVNWAHRLTVGVCAALVVALGLLPSLLLTPLTQAVAAALAAP